MSNLPLKIMKFIKCMVPGSWPFSREHGDAAVLISEIL